MPHKYFADQFDDEEVLFVFRKHPIVMRRQLIWGALMLVVGESYVFINQTIMGLVLGLLGGLILGVLVFLPGWISWYFSIYIVTDQRFIHITQKGLFHRSVVDMALNQIQMVNYEIAGLQQTLFGFGTIMMQTLVGDLIIREVHHPAAIQKKLLEVLRSKGITAMSSVEPVAEDDNEAYEDYETED